MNNLRAFLKEDSGFTLVETVIAFAIVAAALGVLLQAFSIGLRSTSVAEDQTVALLQAQSLLAGIGQERAVAEGEDNGNFENGASWSIHIEPYLSAQGTLQSGNSDATLLYQVEVRVTPAKGPAVVLETLRITNR